MITYRVNKKSQQVEMVFHLRKNKPLDITKGLGKQLKSKWGEVVEKGSKLVWHAELGENVRSILKGKEPEKHLESIKIESFLNEEGRLFKPFLKNFLEFNILLDKRFIDKNISHVDHKFYVSPEKVLDAIIFSRSDKQYLLDLYRTAEYRYGFRTLVVRHIGQIFSKNDTDVYDFLNYEFGLEIGSHGKSSHFYAIERALKSMGPAKIQEDRVPKP